MKMIMKAVMGTAFLLSTTFAHHEGISGMGGFSGSRDLVSYGWPVFVLLVAVALMLSSRRTGEKNL